MTSTIGEKIELIELTSYLILCFSLKTILLAVCSFVIPKTNPMLIPNYKNANTAGDVFNITAAASIARTVSELSRERAAREMSECTSQTDPASETALG